jgi:hypothetical protein
MGLNRARYVTVCQQILVTAVVALIGLSAAGVMNLNFVSPNGVGSTPGAVGSFGTDLAPAVQSGDAYVDDTPVIPKVREVAVAPVAHDAAQRAAAPKVMVTAGGLRRDRTVVAISKPTRVHGFATVGVTWQHGQNLGETQIAVQVRTLQHGSWSAWSTASYHDEHGPDPGSAEAARIRPGTDAVVVGDVTAVQMRAATNSGVAPSDIKLAVIDPGAAAEAKAAPAIDTARIPTSDQSATSAAPIESTAGLPAVAGDTTGDTSGLGGTDAALAAMQIAPKPLIYSRAQWGADESLRDPSSLHYGTIETGFIHHTVNANDYTPQQVPALIRGIYAYHTQSRGWSDIGYNFLIDRFGRIWEGRYGGVDRAVVGAHTLGYNEVSFAASAIGNFDIAEPPQALLDAEARLFAWKLSLANIPADATHLWVKNVWLHAINGHRDVNQTECPGRYLYAKIPWIRTAARRIQLTGVSPTPTPVPTTPTPIPADPALWPLVPAPTGIPLPTTAPRAAVAQPALTFPARTNVLGQPWPALFGKTADGAITIIATGGMLGYNAPVLNSGPWKSMSMVTALGDVTGDGKGDVLAKNATSGYAAVYRTDGRGHVSSRPYAGSYGFKADDMLIAAGDVNHDGRNDVLTRNGATGALTLHKGLGNGTFAPETVVRTSWPMWPTAAVDLNQDGKVDLITANPNGTLLFLAGTGAKNPATSFAKPVVIAKLSGPVSAVMAGADATGDGKPDVAVRYATGLLSLYPGNGAGALGQPFGPYGVTAGMTRLSGTQMLGGTGFDLVGRTPSGQLAVLASNGRHNIASRVTTNLVIPGATQILDVGDWDHNGTADIITREQNGDRLVLRPGLGNGKFGRGRSLGNGWAQVKRLTAVGDVTGDGYPDLMGRIGSGPMLIFPGLGDKGFGAPRLAPVSLRTYNQIGSTPWTPRGAALLSSDGGFVPLSGVGLVSALQAANGSAVTTYDTYVGVGDVNGDGVADVLAREKGTGTLWLLPGKASGGFGPRMWVANRYAGYQLIG